MKNFKISILQLNRSTYTSIPIGQSSSTINLSPFTTYNEKLTQKTNSQQDLSFSITLYYNQQRNPFWDMLLNNQYLRLLLLTNDEVDESIDFIITKITPTISSSNISYSITAQDLFSYQLSKQGIGLTYKTEIPLQIDELVTNILNESNVTHWKVDPLLEQKVFPDFPNTLYNSGTYERMKCSLDLSGSTCYNALVEIANLFNAIIRVSYNENKPGGTIHFINKDRIQFKGYRLLPTVNLNALTLNKDSSNFSSLMYVTGGQDAEDAMVSIIPTMPSIISEWLDMYQVYEKLPSPQLHNYPAAVARDEGDTKLYSLNITRGTSNNRFLGLYEEYGIGEELQCSITFDDLYNASDSYQVRIMEGTEILRSFVASSTFGASLDQTVVNINTTLEEEGTVSLTLLKNGDVVANSPPFSIKYATWKEKSSFTPWEEETDLTKLVARIWNDDNVKKWRNTEGNTLTDVQNYCFMIQNNVKAVGEFLYNFDYFYENDMMDEQTYKALERMFSLNLRNANLKTQILTKHFNSLSYLLRQLVQKEEELVSTVAAAFEQIYEYYKENADLNTTVSSSLYSSKNPSLTREIQKILKGSFVQSLSPETTSSPNEEDPDTVTLQQDCYNQVALAIQDLISLVWTDKYFRLAFMMYGTDYFQKLRKTNRDKQQEYTNNYFDYLDKAQEILNQVEGEDEQEKINNLTYLQQCDYYYYIGKADSIIHLADFYYNSNGEVSREQSTNYPFLKLGYYGCYDLLIGQLVLLNNNNYNNILTSYTWYDSSIVKRLEEQERIRKGIWTTIYENYSPYIIESSYSDSTQLTSSGLYGAAVKQFANVCMPVVDYSASMIDYSSIVDADYDAVQVGDRVRVYNNMLFQKKLKNTLMIQTEDSLDPAATHLIGEDEDDEDDILIHKKERVQNNLYKLTLERDVPHYQWGYITKTDTGQPITILSYAYIADPIDLQITGLTKTLRETNMQLTVQNNQTINSLVDKLLYSVRKS